jgi:uncharacterized protein (TIGR02145 family)
MQTINKYILIFLALCCFQGLQAQVELCPGETLVFELDDRNYYGIAQLEYSPDGINWNFLELTLDTVIAARVEESGFYRVRLWDDTCDTVYYSQVQQVIIPGGQPRSISLRSLHGIELALDDSLLLEISDFNRITELELLINGQHIVPESSTWRSARPEDDVWALVRGRNNMGCLISSDTLRIEIVQVKSFISKVNGFVMDKERNPILGARVRSAFGSKWVMTDSVGYFELDSARVRPGLGSIVVEKEGYFEGSRSFIPAEGGNNVRVRLLDRTVAGTIQGAQGGSVSHSGVQIAFEEGSFERDGIPYGGPVAVSLQYIDPLKEGFAEEMPGDLIAVQNQDTVLMISFGMMGAELRDDKGRIVKLAAGKPARVVFPLSDSLRAYAKPEIDLWSYDTEAGLWVHEGKAILEDSVYKSEVSHFSFWNCDVPILQTKLKGRIIDSRGNPIPNASVRIQSPGLGFASTITNNEGEYCGWVPSGEVLKLQVVRFCFPGAGGEQLLYEDTVGPFSVGTHIINDIVLENCEGSAEVCGWILDEEDNVVPGAVVEIRLGAQSAKVTANVEGEFCILVPANRAFDFSIYRRCMNMGCERLTEMYTRRFGTLIIDRILRDSFRLADCLPGGAPGTTLVEVTSPTGRVWMDRNLGASRVAISSKDSLAYGDLYQWGRGSDGHQCRESPIRSNSSSNDKPVHGDFIINSTIYNDWRIPQNNNLWHGVNGVNNPCPTGYRIPTAAELNAERLSWSSNNAAGALASPLKLTMAGTRNYFDGMLGGVGTSGYYWSSTVRFTRSHYLYLSGSNAFIGDDLRARGHSVRCIKEVDSGNYPIGSFFCTGTTTAIVNVTNPATGKSWMDRNLGASRVALSSIDSLAYGDLYQWGRGSDRHQCRDSPTRINLSSSDQPGHGDFIVGSSNWRSPQNTNLWQGVNGVNNPCPTGYRIPTEAELNAERLSWSSNNGAGSFESPLKLPLAGSRIYSSNGSISNVGYDGYYWSSTVSSTNSRSLHFSSSNAIMVPTHRASGVSVRCIWD